MFIERIRDFTNLRIKITATSGLAGMSLGGSTVDWLLGLGYNLNSKANIKAVETRLSDIQLLIIDEISMMGCRKLLRLDSILRKVFSCS